MAAKICADCGVTLKGLSGTFSQSKCNDCLRITYKRAKLFFERNALTEQDIQNWKFSNSIVYIFGYILFLYLCIVAGCLIGFNMGGTIQGLWYSFIATLLGIILYRWWMNNISIHPLNAHLWFNFAFPYTYIFFFSWAIAYLGWMPGSVVSRYFVGRSIFSHHINIISQVSAPAFWVVLLVGIFAAIVGAIVGLWIASSQFPKNKTHLIALYQRWQQAKV